MKRGFLPSRSPGDMSNVTYMHIFVTAAQPFYFFCNWLRNINSHWVGWLVKLYHFALFSNYSPLLCGGLVGYVNKNPDWTGWNPKGFWPSGGWVWPRLVCSTQVLKCLWTPFFLSQLTICLWPLMSEVSKLCSGLVSWAVKQECWVTLCVSSSWGWCFYPLLAGTKCWRNSTCRPEFNCLVQNLNCN